MSYQPLWLRDLVAYSIQAAALVGVGVIMARALRLRLPRVRHAYWQALLAACVFLPLLQPWRPEVLDTSGLTMASVNFAAPEAAPVPAGPSLAQIVFWLICAGIILRVLWMALGLGRLWIYRRRAHHIEQLPEAIVEAQLLAPEAPAFFISRQIPTPATFGFFRPAILFPARFLEMEPALQKAIALHELLHVERRDWLWNMFEELVLTVLWFHLPLWWVVRSARLSREQVVDAEAVRRSKARRPYLKALLEMAGHKLLAESLPAPLFLREHQLAERVAIMLKEVRMSRTRLTVSILVAAATLFVAGASLVWAFPLKTSAPQTDAPTATSAPQNGDGTFQYQGKDYKYLGKIYQVGKNVSAPVPIYKPEPPYTPEAKKAHLNGPVILWAIIDANGKVTEAKEQSKPLGQGLDKSALDTVRTWKFKPAMREGVAVPVKVMVEVYFRYYDGKKGDPASQNPAAAPDPQPQSNAQASADAIAKPNAYINQAEIQRQVDQAMAQAKLAQKAAAKIDQSKIQEQIDKAMQQVKLAEATTPKIDQAKIRQQIEQAMNQAKIAQEAASKIDQAKIQQQVDEAMKKVKLNEPEMRRQMEEMRKQLENLNTPEMKKQIEQAMAQAKVAQSAAAQVDKAEIERQLEQARQQIKQAMEQAQAARKETEKARKDAAKARKEWKAQQESAKPNPAAEPKPAPPAPKAIEPPPTPPTPPSPPEKPSESAGVVGGVVGGVPGGKIGGVPGGVAGGVVAPATPAPPAAPSPAVIAPPPATPASPPPPPADN